MPGIIPEAERRQATHHRVMYSLLKFRFALAWLLPIWVAWAAGAGLLVALLMGGWAVRALTRPLNRLAKELSALELPVLGGAGAASAVPPALTPALTSTPAPTGSDELSALARSFHHMADRLAVQHEQQHRQATAHREVIANVAHDLRTPLTALHGHLEALRARWPTRAGRN